MNTIMKQEPTGANRENFVSRLYQMLSTPEFTGIVAWNETEEGPSFVILDTAKFQEYVLVNEFHHANFSSFVRQLNKYDFHKVKFRDPHSRVWEFRHPHFRPENRDRPFLIKRKQQSGGRRGRRGDGAIQEQTEVAVKAAELAARDADDLIRGQVTDVESRVDRLEQNNMQIVNALKMQQSLVERLLHVINISDLNDEDHTGLMLDEFDTMVDRPTPTRPRLNVFNSHNGSPMGTVSNSPVVGHSQNSPASPYEPSVPQPEVRMPNGAVRFSALIAVDDAKVREVLIKFLLDFGCRVDSVDNGVDVVQRVETAKYDYILIDYILKALDGVSAVELIRQTDQATPIILLSDPSSGDEYDNLVQRGASAVLYRPFSQAKLYSALQHFMLKNSVS